MILLQLSAGQGPLECCKAVGLAFNCIEKECEINKIKFDVINVINTSTSGCYKSVLLQLGDKQSRTKAKIIAASWQGVMRWICQSPYRPKHKRKNWFFSGQIFEVNEIQLDKTIQFQSCRSSGAGGQHVNTTDSAIRATHVATGLSVRIESERSQHANKRLARALLFQKLESKKLENMTKQEKQRWQQHWDLERGNPVKTFNGTQFSS